MLNNMLLRRKNKVYFGDDFVGWPATDQAKMLVAEIENDIHQFGYTLNQNLAERLALYANSEKNIVQIYKELVAAQGRVCRNGSWKVQLLHLATREKEKEYEYGTHSRAHSPNYYVGSK